MVSLKKQVVAGCAFMAVLLSACGSSNDWSPQPARVLAAEATAPRATVRPASPTTAPRASPTAAQAASVIITPTPLPDSYWDKFPKDEKGRVIGGKVFPVLNYSPTMVTGKPCPRIKKWTYKVMLDAPVPPLQAAAAPSNPCVIQNAIDDYVRTLFTIGLATTQQEAHAVAKLFETDPALIKGVDDVQRQTWIDASKQGKYVYAVCDKQIYRLIDTTHKAPLVSNNDGSIAPHILEIRVMNIAAGLQPYDCEWKQISDNKVLFKDSITAKSIQEGISLPPGSYNRIWLRYSLKTNSWQDFTFGRSMNSAMFLTVANQLLADSPIQP